MAAISSQPLGSLPESEIGDSTTTPASSSFDIVSKYHSLLSADPSLTPPIAAIESLIALLNSTPATTVSETLDLLQHSSNTLRQHVSNPIPLSAGTDLFQRYLMTTLQRPGALGPGGDFNLLRQHLISNSRLFVQRAKLARPKIATYALPFIRDDLTILTYGPSRVVNTLLLHAAKNRHFFRVIYITPTSPSSSSSSSSKSSPISSQISHQATLLRKQSIPVALIPSHAAAHALSTIPKPCKAIVITGASAVLENGGILSLLGTYQLALLAHALRTPFYVAAESYKFVRLYPLGQGDLRKEQRQEQQGQAPAKQNRTTGYDEDDRVVKFWCQGGGEEGGEKLTKTASNTTTKGARHTNQEHDVEQEEEEVVGSAEDQDAVDNTPPELISALITENGVMTPSAVSEELIKLWF